MTHEVFENRPDHWSIYTDESRQNKARFMVLGGLVAPASTITLIQSEMVSFRHAWKLHQEIKWTKTSKGCLPAYIALIDLIFRYIDHHNARFHCMIVERSTIDYRTFHDGDRDLGLSKLYYSLLLGGFGRRYGERGPLHLRMDYSESKTNAEELRTILNRGYAKKYNTSRQPFRLVQRVDSKRYDLIQLTDLLIGAVGWQWNGFHRRADSSRTKSELAHHVCYMAGWGTLAAETHWQADHFTIWKWRPASKVPRG